MLTRHLEESLHRALAHAQSRRHEFVTLEHMLLALIEDADAVAVIRGCNVEVGRLRQDIETYLENGLGSLLGLSSSEAQPTAAFQRVLQRAALHVQSTGRRQEVSGAHVLVAMFSEHESYAVYFLHSQGMTRLDAVNYLSHGIMKAPPSNPAPETPTRASDESAPPSPGGISGADEDATTEHVIKQGRDALAAYCINLNQKARDGRIDPLIGRDIEIARTLQILCRRSKNNPLYVGDPGVGKTAIAEGLARRIVEKQVPEALRETTIYALDLGAMLAGTRYRGDFEERLKNVLGELNRLKDSVLFIDEIHTIIGAGATSGGSMDASNLLKPALADGRLRCIGSTTYKEYRAHFEKDRALARRFQKIDVAEPSHDDAVRILSGVKGGYERHHGVRYTSEAVRAAVTLSARHLNDRRLPDKAIDVLDEAGARQHLSTENRRRRVIGAREVEEVIAQMARMPVKRLTQDDRSALMNLEGEIKSAIYGQDNAIDSLVCAVKLARAGLRDPNKPTGCYLFSGPTGVGKTEVARQLSHALGVELLRFDMSEYMERHSIARLIGAPPGYVGFDQGGLLTDAVDQNPHAVLLLDEIEKAHTDIYSLLLQVMDHGRLTDHNGKSVDFRHIVLIMTTNAGAAEMAKAPIGFGRDKREGEDAEAINRLFTPEFRNRLDAIIPFASLTPDTMGRIVDKFVLELEGQLRERHVNIVLTQSAREFLAQKGYDPVFGARPLARAMQEHLKQPLAEEILFGRLAKGGTVTVDMAADSAAVSPAPRLAFTYAPPAPIPPTTTRGGKREKVVVG
ncbi:MAG: ATP-dependent Clp protease ATP-binding subunit ClpA [Alphaproteobacteria bacterium]|nr:MAG: ATP-dependent Clp protease ATP-binding subunit ClpA [Alphaproteobacteria bacterium]